MAEMHPPNPRLRGREQCVRILILANIVPARLGGYEEFIARLAETCRSAGDECIIAAAGAPAGRAADRWQSAGVRWEVLPGWTDANGVERPWRFVAPAVRLVSRHAPDIVAVRFGNELPVCAAALLCGRLKKKPIWVWEQDQQIRKAGFAARLFSRARLAGAVCGHMIAVSERIRTGLVERGIPQSRISVIRNGVSDWPARADRGLLRREIGAGSADLVVGMVSSLIPRKRVDVAIRGFAAAGLARAVLVVIGGGPLEAKLRAEAESAGVAERVRFMGPRSDARDLLGGLDVFVHTSSAEGCAYAISEAMCAGLPVVAADAGASAEQILDGVTGFVAPVGDAGRTAERLRILAENPDLRRSMGAAARARWREMFRVERMVGLYIETCRSFFGLLNGRTRRISANPD